MRGFDVAIVGGGVVGTSAALFLARAGARVVLIERAELAAGASGRNSGAVQQPLDPLPAELHRRTLEMYRDLAAADAEFDLGQRPAGLLLLSPDEAAVGAEVAALQRAAPELAPRHVAPDELRRLEPALAAGLAACRLETGYPVAPASATLAFARQARLAGTELRLGRAAAPVLAKDRLVGVRLAGGELIECGQALLAAGPSTPELVPAWREQPPIRPLWGVVVSVGLKRPPAHVLEELAIGGGPLPPMAFSLVTAGGSSGVGSLFVEDEPDPAAIAGDLLRRGATFVPEIASAPAFGVRACARPLSLDRRPLVGAAPGYEGLFVCAGHGPWGISTGPATAELVAAMMLRSESAEPAGLSSLDPSRYTPA